MYLYWNHIGFSIYIHIQHNTNTYSFKLKHSAHSKNRVRKNLIFLISTDKTHYNTAGDISS